jgi:hypothetical protein
MDFWALRFSTAVALLLRIQPRPCFGFLPPLPLGEGWGEGFDNPETDAINAPYRRGDPCGLPPKIQTQKQKSL